MTGSRRLISYLRFGYGNVEGASSKIAAEVAGSLMHYQTGQGWYGPAVEIGVFRGRYAIALAHALTADEKLIALDLFDGYQPGMEAAFRTNLARHKVPAGAVDVWAVNSGSLPETALRDRIGGAKARLIHIDGEHTYAGLSKDLVLSVQALAPPGIIIIDDMHHPWFPRLMQSMFDFLGANREFQVLAIIDRASVVAAAKYVLCRKDYVGRYTEAILAAFPSRSRRDQADFEDHKGVFVTAKPYRLAVAGGLPELLIGRVRKRWRKFTGA